MSCTERVYTQGGGGSPLLWDKRQQNQENRQQNQGDCQPYQEIGIKTFNIYQRKTTIQSLSGLG